MHFLRPVLIGLYAGALPGILGFGCQDRFSPVELSPGTAPKVEPEPSLAEEPAARYQHPPLEAHAAPESYRFDLRMDEARVTAAPAQDNSSFHFRFDYEKDTAPWTIFEGNARCEVADNRLIMETETLARFDSPPINGAPAKDVPTIFLNARISGCKQFTLAWRGQYTSFMPNSEAIIDVAESDDWILYSIDTAPFFGWNSHLGNVTQLRINLPENARMELRFLGLADEVDRFAGKSYGQVDYTVDRWKYIHSMFARTPAVFDYDVTVMPDARLTTDFLLPDHEPGHFRIVLQDGTDEVVVLAEKEVAGRGTYEHVADLAQWEGRNVRIRFEAESQKPGNVALWGNPTLERVYPVTAVKRPINVIWYVIDCLRPVNLSAYGYERETTPTMEAVAAEGVRFDWCFAPGSWTVDSVASFLTGLSPSAHGMTRIHRILPDSMTRLPGILRETGYATALVSQNQYVDKHMGYSRGFDEAYLSRVRGAGRRKGGENLETYPLNVQIEDYLRENKEKPFFLYVHTIEPHGPYIPPDRLRLFGEPTGTPSDNDLFDNMDLYDGCVLWADQNLGYTIENLKKEGLWNNTLLIVSSDHGQSFTKFDAGLIGHGGEPYLSRAWIPLIMRLPGFVPESMIVEENVQALDIPATLFDLLEIDPDPQFGGKSLLGLIDGSAKVEFAGRSIFSTGQLLKWQAVVQDRWFFLDNDGKMELIDLQTNPVQSANVAENHPEIVQKLYQETLEFREEEAKKAERYTVESPESLEIDLERRRALEAIGYLN